ncbi:FHA domain-containing protein [Streptomyces sp. KLOTTS4A1]|uniref:FHA domain-containing protein n=1 Tax=Streptomyces sp. KLOTTS4A1 TaxID=3390996 RepID=UPI0039F46537
MFSVIVVPPGGAGPERQFRIGSGERVAFGRAAAADGGLVIDHEGVPRAAGEITAHRSFWLISNFSTDQTYVVENPEGAGEHIKITPGRLDAPVPFEFARVVLPAGGDLLSFDVWAPRHAFRSADRSALPGPATAPAFSLDPTKRYYAVLAALCEPRLRGAPRAPLPTVEELVERLRPTCPAISRTSVYWNIDYLTMKLRLRPEDAESGRRANGKKESLVSLALRFDLVRESDLVVLAPTGGGADDSGKAGSGRPGSGRPGSGRAGSGPAPSGRTVAGKAAG